MPSVFNFLAHHLLSFLSVPWSCGYEPWVCHELSGWACLSDDSLAASPDGLFQEVWGRTSDSTFWKMSSLPWWHCCNPAIDLTLGSMAIEFPQGLLSEQFHMLSITSSKLNSGLLACNSLAHLLFYTWIWQLQASTFSTSQAALWCLDGSSFLQYS